MATEDAGVPHWSRDGKRLLFLKGMAMVQSDVDTSDGFAVGDPRPFGACEHRARVAHGAVAAPGKGEGHGHVGLGQGIGAVDDPGVDLSTGHPLQHRANRAASDQPFLERFPDPSPHQRFSGIPSCGDVLARDGEARHRLSDRRHVPP